MMVGARRVEEPSRTRQYVAGSETRVRPPARQDPAAQQDSGEKCGLALLCAHKRDWTS
jgi:hypothetical protein